MEKYLKDWRTYGALGLIFFSLFMFFFYQDWNNLDSPFFNFWVICLILTFISFYFMFPIYFASKNKNKEVWKDVLKYKFTILYRNIIAFIVIIIIIGLLRYYLT